MKKERGVYEKVQGSKVWWIRYVDAEGNLRREKAGTKSAAIRLRTKRKGDAWEGKKLPKKLRARVVRFSELADDYATYAQENNLGKNVDKYRIAMLRDAFGGRPAEIPIADLRQWFASHDWEPGTFNRVRTVLGSIYRIAIENKKAESNPARLIKHQKEPIGRVRYLNQHNPAEESRLRNVILAKWPQHLPELDIALNTGMRRSEQYSRIDWKCIDFLQRDLFVPESKNGHSRHIPLNDQALSAFQELFTRTRGEGPIFASERGGTRLLGARHWFEDALKIAKITDFTWHSLRHSFASRLVMAGVDLRTVAELMGHKKIEMTMRYAHLAPAHKMNAIEKLSEFNRKSEGFAILNAPARERTDTRTDTGQNGSLGTDSVNVQ
jgi:site-specific recombinase XerD